LTEGCLYYTSNWKSSCDFDTKLFQSTLDAGEKHSNASRCFHSTLAKLPGILPSFIRTPQAEIMQCYLTACAGPDKLKIGVDNVWYDCPYEGGIVQPIEYGGEITCQKQAADVVCAGVEDDFTWPTVTRISPHKAKPGDNITIYGNHFDEGSSLYVTLNKMECPNVEVISSTQLLVTLPNNDKFSSIVQMGLFSRRFSVVVTDEKGRTGQIKDVILIETTLDGSDIGSFFQRFGFTPALLSIVTVLILIILCVGCIYWCCRSWKIMEQEHGLSQVVRTDGYQRV